MLKIGLIGFGYWGPNHLRVFSQLDGSDVLMCSDLSEQRLDAVQKSYPDVTVTSDYRDVLKNDEIDAVVVATPTNTHYEVAKNALEAGKHVLCEKPLSLDPKECEDLKHLAKSKHLILVIGHIFLFNAGIRRLKEYLNSDEFGSIQYGYSTRVNLGPFRYDVNALWDLAPHDISIFNYLFDSAPVRVSGRGHKPLGTKLEDVAFATLEYPNGIMINLHVSWLDPKKVRQITLVGDKKMVLWDDLNTTSPIQIYDKHVEKTSTYYETYGEFQMLSQEGSILMPKVRQSEPLKAQAQFFLDCIAGKEKSNITDAQKGEDVVRTLCGIQQSIEQNGAVVDDFSERGLDRDGFF